MITLPNWLKFKKAIEILKKKKKLLFFKNVPVLGSNIARVNLVAEIVTTQNHVFFLYDHYGSRGFEPPFFLKPRPRVRSQ